MSQIKVNIENYVSMDAYPKENGTTVAVLMKTLYVGDEDTPSFEEEVLLDTLLQEYIDSHSIPTSPVHSLKKEIYDELSAGLQAMADAIERAKARLESMPYWEKPSA